MNIKEISPTELYDLVMNCDQKSLPTLASSAIIAHYEQERPELAYIWEWCSGCQAVDEMDKMDSAQLQDLVYKFVTEPETLEQEALQLRVRQWMESCDE